MLKIIEDNLIKLEARLQNAADACHRDRASFSLLAVSKTQVAEALRECYQLGQRHFGENYLQEALDKQVKLNDLSITWHFIGPIQSNKTRAIAENFDWVHSVDRVKIARRLSEQRPKAMPPLKLCLQVNLDAEESKSGVALNQITALAEEIASLPGVQLRGLMAIPMKQDDPKAQQHSFSRLFNALESLQETLPRQPLDTLSMGMSGDLEAAIAAGSTLVRVGTDIFGARRQ